MASSTPIYIQASQLGIPYADLESQGLSGDALNAAIQQRISNVQSGQPFNANEEGTSAISPYGPNAFQTGVTVTDPNGESQPLNPIWFASDSTANQVAQQLGGKVVQTSPYGTSSGFSASQAQNMVQLPDGSMVNPAAVAQLYTHGYSQEYINSQLSKVLAEQGDANAAQDALGMQSQPVTYSNTGNATPLQPTPITQGGAQGVSSSNNPSSSNPASAPGAQSHLQTGAPNPSQNPSSSSYSGRNANYPGSYPQTLPSTYNSPGGPPTGAPTIPGEQYLNPTPGPGATIPTTNPGSTPVGRTPGGAPSGGNGGYIPGSGQTIPGQNPPTYGNVPPGYSGLPTYTQAGGPSAATPWGMPNFTNEYAQRYVGLNVDNLTYANLLANQASMAENLGLNLMSYNNLATQSFNAREQGLAQAGDALNNYILQHPGYTQDQANAIMDAQGLNALQYSPDEAQALALTPSETSIGVNPATGLPGVYANYSAMRGYFSPQAQQQMSNTVQGTNDAMQQAYEGGANATNATIDPEALGLSSDYTQNYSWTPQDTQNLMEAAGRNVGEQVQAQHDELARQYAAAGTNAPLAQAAAQNRLNQTGMSSAADTMTQAAIEGKQQALQVAQTREATRLGAQQYLTGISNQTQQNLMNTGISTAQAEGQQKLANQQYLANTGMNLEDQINQGQVAQAQWAAANRQAMTQWSQGQAFTQGAYADQAQSNRATQIANAQKADVNSAQQDIRTQQQQSQTGAQQSNTSATAAYGAMNASGAQSLQTAEALANTQAQLPGLGQQIGAGIAGAAATAAGFLARGGVITRPTVATIGERGPEAVVPLRPPAPTPAPHYTGSRFASKDMTARGYSRASRRPVYAAA